MNNDDLLSQCARKLPDTPDCPSSHPMASRITLTNEAWRINIEHQGYIVFYYWHCGPEHCRWIVERVEHMPIGTL